ncbi:MAG TPA: site-specific DNA-methyltransferase [Candidatus Acidoferrales bacterium]|nr:site-specific DNA-methyltransferase [Candidatus Acidoferrales bacterium]
MTPYYEQGNVTLHLGNCFDILRDMEDCSIDAVVADPPYGLEFQGENWDAPWKTDRRQIFDGTLHDDRNTPFSRSKVRYGLGASYGASNVQMVALQQWHHAWAAEALRVLKPGGYLLSFGGARTYHRLACAIEDAGFEIRDQVMWVYGNGYPKSLNVSKAISKVDGKKLDVQDWSGWGTALKPSHEPICVARKPLDGTVAANVLKWGTGAINVDGGRIKHVTVAGGNLSVNSHLRDHINGGNGGNIFAHEQDRRINTPVDVGRFPSNFIHDGSEEVLACFPRAGPTVDRLPVSRDGESSSEKRYADTGGTSFSMTPGPRRLDEGSAARFFYCAKASSEDREENMDGAIKNDHPTVKPLRLMRYLCRLVTPPGGTILDPFVGSGTTLKAARAEGFRSIGIEMNQHYAEIAVKRLAQDVFLFPSEEEVADADVPDTLG